MPQEHKLHYFATSIFWIINAGTILIVLLLINHLLIPIWPTINMRFKLGIGLMFNVLSFGVAGIIQLRKDDLNPSPYFFWLVLPIIPLSTGETVTFVSSELIGMLSTYQCCVIIIFAGLEFIYAQSPNNMKGLQTGIIYLTFGIFSAVGTVLYFCYPFGSCGNAWFCFILVSIGSVGFVVYTIVACCYKNRQRPTTDGSEYETQCRVIYSNVFDSPT